MALNAVVHKGGFYAGLNPRDLSFIDIVDFLLVGRVLDIKIVEPLPVNERNTLLFFLSSVYEHSFHYLSSNCCYPRGRRLITGYNADGLPLPDAVPECSMAGAFLLMANDKSLTIKEPAW